jgi:hypothetical protein
MVPSSYPAFYKPFRIFHDLVVDGKAGKNAYYFILIYLLACLLMELRPS